MAGTLLTKIALLDCDLRKELVFLLSSPEKRQIVYFIPFLCSQSQIRIRDQRLDISAELRELGSPIQRWRARCSAIAASVNSQTFESEAIDYDPFPVGT